jgi:hypothetical protein
MQHVDVRHAGKRRVAAVEHEPGLHERQVERLAVIGHNRACLGGDLGDGVEQRALRREAGQHELPDPERRAVEPAAPDQERVGAGAASQTGGFEVNEQRASGAGGIGQQMQVRPLPIGARHGVSDGDVAMAVTRAIGSIDDQEPLPGHVVPLTPQDGGCAGGVERIGDAVGAVGIGDQRSGIGRIVLRLVAAVDSRSPIRDP